MAAVVDLSLPVEECAAALYKACTTSGFAVLINHGVPQAAIDGMFDASRRFFALPTEVKRKALATESPHNRGYSPPNEQKLDSAAAKADTKEGYYIGRELPTSERNPLQGPNAWPDEALVPGYRSAMSAYFSEVLALGDRMLERLALALGLPQGWFADKFDLSIATLRPLHYSATDEPGDMGAGAHTDFGCITLLTTDDQPGLQLLLGGEWVSVPPAPGSFVMNIGDMLERWSNSKFKSTMHRVLNTGAERYSTAFFIDANYDAVVECLPTCTGPDNPPKYAPVLAGHHLMNRLRGTHTQHALEGARTEGAASA
ncbi:putative 2-oxoglutarate-dependent dioxygenase [Micractinium conductrix]|uniref:2-oxoglutarate-dependent dioxygenase n=1 Tax=Micractinium conductrix TaxID=554055 RepID=A0A2P6V7G6_9CHLO|nr:putative 2-oxoglutarate-dependent dioxygenase [Micractinium conductrix]|eukprot:PSC70026.1 putative 2-oxoglutarate-dependent dioxygenase [Micractinium conductrix]